MSYIVLARKWRPKTFDEIIGQTHITTTLKNAIEQDRVAHAYLFCGPRGTGKTTTARLLAKALNCEKGPTPTPCNKCNSCTEITEGRSLDIIEIDAASNRGIDDVRAIRENVKFSPQYGKYKVYIIDEVHMLTPEAFNALLKTLEEPPAHVKFIFATTASHKVIATVISRCQKFDFKRIPIKEIISKLQKISKKEKIDIDDESLFAIARSASGSMRDAESIMDQLNSFTKGRISFDSVSSVLGLMPHETLGEFAQNIIKKDTGKALKLIDKILNQGKDGYQFLINLIEYFRNILISKQGEDLHKLLDIPKDEAETVSKQAASFTTEDILYILYTLISTQSSIRFSPSVRIPLEMLAVKLTRRESIVSLAEILKRIATLEKMLSQTTAPVATAEKPAPIVTALDDKTKYREPVDLYKLREVWTRLIKKIKLEKMYLASCMEVAEIIEFKDNVLTLGYAKNDNFHKGVIEKSQNKKMVEDTISELLGSRVLIECITSDKIKSPSREIDSDAKQQDSRPRPVSKESMKKILSDPIIQSAIDIFDGSIMKFQ